MDGFAAALTPAGLVGQLPFLLLVLAVLATRLNATRRLIMAAAATGVIHAVAFGGGPVAAIWWGLLLGATLLAIGRRAVEDARVRFTDDEEQMLRGVLSGLPRARARHLLDQGFWLHGNTGDVLTREDEPVTHLYYLAAGEARVVSHDRQVGTCRPGDLIGEATMLSGDQASATVILASPARFWCMPAAVLRPYMQTHEDVGRTLQKRFASSLKAKLRTSNERMAEAGGASA